MSAAALLAELHADAELEGDAEEATLADDQAADLIACQMALKSAQNDYERAKAYLFSNVEELRKEGRLELTKIEQAALNGAFEDVARKLRVNLQVGEVVINNRSLVPLPSRITIMDEYRGVFGDSQWCTIVGGTEEGEWFQIEEDGYHYQIFAFKPALA
jgi:hypothetical protein